LNRHTILLIVEADPHYARVLIDVARDRGFNAGCPQGAEALELAKQFQPAAVSLDVFLPDMLGWTVLASSRTIPSTRHIPVRSSRSMKTASTLWRAARSPLSTSDHDGGVSAACRSIKDTPGRAASASSLSKTTQAGTGEHQGTARLRRYRDRYDRTAKVPSPPWRHPCDRVVLDLRLPDMKRFWRCSIRSAMTIGWSSVPVVVSPGGNSPPKKTRTPHHGQKHRGEGRRSPNGCSMKRRCFCTVSSRTLPIEKQRLLEKLNSSDEDLVGKTALLVDDDARQHLCA